MGFDCALASIERVSIILHSIHRIFWPSLQSEEAEDVVSQAVAPSVMLSEKEAEVDELEHVLNREQSSDLRAARAFSFPWRRGGN